MKRIIHIIACVAVAAAAEAKPADLVQPGSFEYKGAFRLPEGDERPETFAYGGSAMTFNPDGDPHGAGDDYPGSLFIMGHPRLAYGELPNGNQIAEIRIPKPVVSRTVDGLGRAEFTQPFRDAAQGLFKNYAEIPVAGMAYLDATVTGPKIHLAWGQHFHEDEQERGPTHAWIDPDLAAPKPQGEWYIGKQSFYSVNGYLFDIPATWADAYTGGRRLATGRFRDGGWSGQGPSLFAYQPWGDGGSPAPSGARLEEKTLLLYQSSKTSDDVVNRSLKGYQHPDEWEGGAWLTTTSGKTAVLLAGTKGVGAKYWYGWVNPAGPEIPCVETAFVNDFHTCRLADGTPCPKADLKGCEGHNDFRGWWTARWSAQFILYNPDDLARVAKGESETWKPQPYANVTLDDHLFLNPSNIEEGMLGKGQQRRYRISAVAYDRANDLLYVLEPFADEAKPVVHVWRIR